MDNYNSNGSGISEDMFGFIPPNMMYKILPFLMVSHPKKNMNASYIIRNTIMNFISEVMTDI